MGELPDVENPFESAEDHALVAEVVRKQKETDPALRLKFNEM